MKNYGRQATIAFNCSCLDNQDQNGLMDEMSFRFSSSFMTLVSNLWPLKNGLFSKVLNILMSMCLCIKNTEDFFLTLNEG